MSYEFTNNWFEKTGIKLWQEIVPLVKPQHYLEIGSYEGASAIWMAENIVGLETITCIDTWQGSADIPETKMIGVKERFDKNIAIVKKKLFKPPQFFIHEDFSINVLAEGITGGAAFDFYDMIYIDGSHKAVDVLQDAVMAWPLLKPGGLMFFDDYLWYGDEFYRCPKPAIDAFCNLHSDDACVIRSGAQVVVQKDNHGV